MIADVQLAENLRVADAFEALTPAEQRCLLFWIERTFVHATSQHPSSSYGLKHRFEADTSIYVTSDAFTYGMVLAGLPRRRRDEAPRRVELLLSVRAAVQALADAGGDSLDCAAGIDAPRAGARARRTATARGCRARKSGARRHSRGTLVNAERIALREQWMRLIWETATLWLTIREKNCTHLDILAGAGDARAALQDACDAAIAGRANELQPHLERVAKALERVRRVSGGRTEYVTSSGGQA